MLDFDLSPYYDDFNATNGANQNGYMQILFKPGYAVQARELTQIQSILQNQIGEFANNIFVNGSIVSGSELTYDNSVTSLQLQPYQGNIPITLEDFNDKLIVNYNSGPQIIRAKVIAVDTSLASNTSAGALAVKYLTGIEFADGDEIQTVVTGAESSDIGTLLTANSSSAASIVSINGGVFFVDGYFVTLDPQTIILDSLSNLPTCMVGLNIEENVVNYTSDSALLDPAQGSFNYQAPGADRYQIKLVLAQRSLDSPDTSKFIRLMTIENGVVTSQLGNQYINNPVLAQRTYDQSGNFTVKPFIVTAADNTADSNNATFLLDIAPGRAYVKGYEFDTTGKISIVVDKARSTNTSNSYFLTLDYGNYVTTTNVHSGNAGFFNLTQFPNVDLHMITSAQINTANQWAYCNTRIGTARIRDIEYAGSNSFYAYLTDIKTNPITANAGNVSSNTRYLSLPAYFSTVANAYIGTTISIVAGNSSGDVRNVVTHDTSNGALYVDVPFSQLPSPNTQFVLNYGTQSIQTMVQTPATYTAANVYATQNAINGGVYPVLDISPLGQTSVTPGSTIPGNTIVYQSTGYNNLLFQLPNSYVSQNSISKVSFYSRKTLLSQTFASGNLTISSGSGLNTSTEVLTFGVTNGWVSDILANEDVFVVVKSNTGSSLANGTVIVFNKNGGACTSGNGIYQTSPTSMTINVASGGTFTGDIIFTVQEGNPTGAETYARRTKTLVPANAFVQLQTYDTPSTATAVLGVTGVSVNTSTGYIWFNGSSPITSLTAGVPQSLYVPDIVNVVKVYDSGNLSYAPNTVNAIDLTSSFTFSTGQTDNYYDHGSITLKPGYPAPKGQVLVVTQFFNHDTTAGFFNADSYSSSIYASGSIPVYNSTKLGQINLRDTIDFRPTRTIGTLSSVASFTLSPFITPDPEYPMELNYSYYLPRIDKLALSSTQTFKLISGTPSLTPVAPPDSENSMTLYTINVPAYTYYSSNVGLTYVNNQRYTMADIGSLDRRITAIEQYVVLSQLQQSVLQQSVAYQNGSTVKNVYGAVTDSFDDNSILDVNNPDNSVTFISGNCYPKISTTPVKFDFTGKTNTGAFFQNTNDKTTSLTFTEAPIITQNTATTSIEVQPYAFGEFLGHIALSPQIDYFYSQTLIPANYDQPNNPPPATSNTKPITGTGVIPGNPTSRTITTTSVGGQLREVQLGSEFNMFNSFGGNLGGDTVVYNPPPGATSIESATAPINDEGVYNTLEQ